MQQHTGDGGGRKGLGVRGRWNVMPARKWEKTRKIIGKHDYPLLRRAQVQSSELDDVKSLLYPPPRTHTHTQAHMHADAQAQTKREIITRYVILISLLEKCDRRDEVLPPSVYTEVPLVQG